MLKAMLYKELRETAWIALLSLLVHAYFVLALMNIVRYVGSNRVPFATDDFLGSFSVVAAALAAVLGFRQTLTESVRGTWFFLLHRPTARWKLLAVKLLTGAGLYLAASAVPVLAYAGWAATPGKHASPFDWSMTLACWQAWFAMATVYLAAFLSGLRPGRWFGTRLAPLAGVGLLVGLLVVLVQMAPGWWPFATVVILLIDAWLVGTILFVARTRDYS